MPRGRWTKDCRSSRRLGSDGCRVCHVLFCSCNLHRKLVASGRQRDEGCSLCRFLLCGDFLLDPLLRPSAPIFLVPPLPTPTPNYLTFSFMSRRSSTLGLPSHASTALGRSASSSSASHMRRTTLDASLDPPPVDVLLSLKERQCEQVRLSFTPSTISSTSADPELISHARPCPARGSGRDAPAPARQSTPKVRDRLPPIRIQVRPLLCPFKIFLVQQDPC